MQLPSRTANADTQHSDWPRSWPSISAALLAPAWYLVSGCSQLLAAACLLPSNMVALGQLLVFQDPPDPVQQEYFQKCFVGVNGLLKIILGHCLFSVSALAAWYAAVGAGLLFRCQLDSLTPWLE